MNIIARPYGSRQCYCRPDTTLQKENRDLYCPESVESISWTPVIFARISKAGKCVGEKFASRYYDGVSFGTLLYFHDSCHPEDKGDAGISDLAFTSCADHTSVLPFPLYNPVVMENGNNTFVIRKDNEVLYTCQADGVNAIEKAIIQASQKTSLRIGDLIAAELAPIDLLASRKDGDVHIDGVFCENDIFSFRIIF